MKHFWIWFFPTECWEWTFTTSFCYEKTWQLAKVSLLHHKRWRSAKKNKTGPKKGLVALLKVNCTECLPLLHHVPGGTLRKATEMNVVTARVTWFIVREEIRVQRQRMHPFIKEMHTRVCLSIHKFCIFFDFKDLSIYDREENTPVSRTNKVLLQSLSSAFKTRVCSLVPPPVTRNCTLEDFNSCSP